MAVPLQAPEDVVTSMESHVPGTPERPLEGMLVLDLGQVYNGPYCGLMLGFLGARVVKIEPPTGDVVRGRIRGDRDPYPYLMLNSNKESVILDLKLAEGRDAFLRLADQADVVVENFTVGVMERLGIGWDVLRARNPRLVYGSGKGFGLSGPYRDYAAMDLTVQAISGAMNATGWQHMPPVKAGPAVSDFLGGIHLAAGILGALVHRERTGVGQLVEGSMHEAMVWACASALGAYVDSGPGAVPDRTDNRHPALAIAPYNVYPAKDGHVAIFCLSARHWESLTDLMGRPELATDPRFEHPVDRAENMEAIDEIVSDWTCGLPKLEVMEALRRGHVPGAPVSTMADIVDDPQLLARGAFVDVEHPDRGRVRLPTAPVRLHGSKARGIERTAPALGQDTDRVLAELLGASADELRRLQDLGVTAKHMVELRPEATP